MDKCYYTDKYCYGFLNTSPLRNDSICSYFWFVKWSHPMESGGQPWAQWESCFPEEEVRPPERFSSHQLPRRHTWNGRDSPEILKACWQPPPPDSACPNPDQWETIPAATSLSCAPFMQFPIEVIFLLESLLVSFPNKNPHCSHADPQWGPCDLASSHISSCITALRPRLSQHTHTHTHTIPVAPQIPSHTLCSPRLPVLCRLMLIFPLNSFPALESLLWPLPQSWASLTHL